MQDTLYYWPLPFRGVFMLYAAAVTDVPFNWADMDGVAALKSAPVSEQPVPFMAPPLYHDADADLWVSQLPAILMHLGDKFDLLPPGTADRARTLKLICDANDVLEEMTCNCGRTMWTQEAWNEFAATRLPRWMQVFEETATRSGMTENSGTILGTAKIGMADLATAALWSTMLQTFDPLRPLMGRHAPITGAHCARISALPEIRAAFDARASQFATGWCGGQIEASLRSVLAAWPGPDATPKP